MALLFKNLEDEKVLVRSNTRKSKTGDGEVHTSRVLWGYELVVWKDCGLAKRFGLPGFPAKPMTPKFIPGQG